VADFRSGRPRRGRERTSETCGARLTVGLSTARPGAARRWRLRHNGAAHPWRSMAARRLTIHDTHSYSAK